MRDPARVPEAAGYEFIRLAAHGSMGSIWEARDRTGRTVAVKLPDRARRVERQDQLSMFRREALVTLNLRHPNLLRAFEVGETADGCPFLSMELLRGVTLSQRVASDGPMREAELIAVGHALASALEHAHSLGLIHRDVKPDNVMLLEDGTVRLVDFSLVCEAGDGGIRCGTPAFASPEVIRGQRVGPAADLYSLGMTLATAALGRPVFDAPDVNTLFRRSLRTPLSLPADVGGVPLSDGLRAIVERLARKDPDERYGSAGEVRLDLEVLRDGGRPLGAYIRRALRRGPRRFVVIGGVGLAAALVAAVEVGRRIGSAADDGAPPPPSARANEAVVMSPDPVVEDRAFDAAVAPAEAASSSLAARRAAVEVAATLARSPQDHARLQHAREQVAEAVEAMTAAELSRWREVGAKYVAAGDLAGIERLAASWPADLAGVAQEAAARVLVAGFRAQIEARADPLLAEAEAVVAAGDAGARSTDEEISRLIARLRAVGDGGVSEATVRRAQALADELGRLLEIRARRVRRDAIDAAGRRYLDASNAPNGTGAPGALVALAGLAQPDATDADLAAVARAVTELAGLVDAAMTEQLRKLAKDGFALCVDGRLVVGKAGPAPRAADVLRPIAVVSVEATGAGVELSDLSRIVPDPSRLASWLLLTGELEAARVIAPEQSDPRALLDLLVPPTASMRRSSPSPSIELELRARAAMVLGRVDDPAASAGLTDDPVMSSWVRAARRRPRGGVRGESPRSGGPDALDEARRATFEDDNARAWALLETVVRQRPEDPEVAMLRCRVLESAASQFRTVGVSVFALSEACRARDLDPAMAEAQRLCAEQLLAFRERHPGPFADALRPVAVTACAEVDRLGRGTVAMLRVLGEERLADGHAAAAVTYARRASKMAPDDPDVALLLARAADAIGDTRQARDALRAARARMGPDFPPWAVAMLKRVTER